MLSTDPDLPQAPAANSISVFTAVIVIISLGSFVVTVQTKVSALSPEHGMNTDTSQSFLVVKCTRSYLSCDCNTDDDIDRSSRGFAS